ncbi:MAG: mechanosensitive ion channel [Deltaproteobacteria bacterium]|nr:mechanosensitive ion channel [Deltaproteobacteria bacterium]
MHTAARCGRLRPTATLLLVLTLASLPSLAAFGQQGSAAEEKTAEQKVQELSEDLRARGADLEELKKTIEKHDDSATAPMMDKELSDRRARYRRDVSKLVTLVLTGEDAGATVADGRALAADLLEKDARSMREKLQALAAETLSAIPRSSRLIEYLDVNIDERKQLGLDVEADTAFIIKRLGIRADFVAGLLQNSKEEIDEIVARPGSDQDVEAQKELAALKGKRDALAKSQRSNVRLMDEYGLETANLKQGIITATGKLSQDILNKDVAAGLVEQWIANSTDWFRSNGTALIFQVLTFLLILVAFWFIARLGRGTVRRGLGRSKLHISSLAQDFFIKMTGRIIMLFGLLIAIAQLGIEIAPLLAGLGIAGLVIGFALQDTLSNFASGLMILVYRPFDVGDVIEAGGVMGKVDQMNLVSTMVLTFDNQLLVVPNQQIWGGVIRNVTHQDTRRVDMKFGIGYSDDIPKAEKVLADIVTSHEKVLKDPEPVIRLHELGDSSVNFVVRPWSKTDEYWDVYWDITREVKRRFDEEGISIPFPQRDVHIYREDAGDAASAGNEMQRSRTNSTAQTVVPGEDDEA